LGQVRNFSYNGLNREVCKFANVLKSMGVEKGDIVTIYMPQIPELVFAMLACAKIGAIHSVVYGGFSTEALASRIDDAHSRVLITADGGWRRGKQIDLKSIANEAMERSPSIEVCICVKNNGLDVEMESGRDFWLHDLKDLPIASPRCETEKTSSEDPLFILYTSGTTGKWCTPMVVMPCIPQPLTVWLSTSSLKTDGGVLQIQAGLRVTATLFTDH